MYTHACTHTQSRFFSIRISFSFALLLLFSCSLSLSIFLSRTLSLSLALFCSLSRSFFLSRKRHVRLVSLDTHGKKSNLFPLEGQNTLTTLLLNLRENVRVARCECGCAYVCGCCVCVRVFVSVRVRGDACVCVWWRVCGQKRMVYWDASTIGNGFLCRLKELGVIPCFGVRHHCFPHVQWQRLAVH